MPDHAPPISPGDAGQPPSARGSRDRPWVGVLRNATLAGLAVSLAAHAVFLLIAIYINFFGPVGAGDGPAPVEFAVVSQAELAELTGQAVAEPTLPPVPELPATDLDVQTPIDLPTTDSLLATEIDVPAESLNFETGDFSEVGDSGGASFFGVEAQGSRFAYIVDTSGSMSIGGKIETLRDELATSVDALTPKAEFCIFLYSSFSRPLGDRGDWVAAATRGKSWARRLIAQIPADGATNPLPAFAMAHALRPRPDAIYFMTDGEFHPDTVEAILADHAGLDIPIHCITFVS